METASGYYLGIKFPGSEKSYYFSCPDNDFTYGDLVIVMTPTGVEAGVVTILPAPLSAYAAPLELKSILRKADKRDVADFKRNQEDAKRVLEITRREIENLDLPMNLIDAFFTIDGSKVTVTYTSEKRVDFRELLKVLSPQIGCRIELRQIASRDKAKMIGGIGICGLPLCCSTFLNQFEGISIQRAKNQMLTLNIPKLSGPCGKLICCLTFEDDAYTEAKKEFPRFGTVVKLDEGPYTVDAINILSRTVRLVNSNRSDFKTFPLEDVQAMLNGTYKRRVEIVRAEDAPLPSFGIESPRQNNENPRNNQQNNQNSNRNNNRNGNRNNNNNNQNRQQNGNRNGNQNGQNQNGQNRNNGPRQNGNQQRHGGNQNNQQRPNNQQPRPNKPQQGNPQQGEQQQQGGGHRNRHRHRHGHGHGGNNGNTGGQNGQ